MFFKKFFDKFFLKKIFCFVQAGVLDVLRYQYRKSSKLVTKRMKVLKLESSDESFRLINKGRN